MSVNKHLLRILIITGPTRERIDDVRYISNFSSGKMGEALALAAQGCDVEVISGPVSITYPSFCNVEFVESACEMHASALLKFKNADIVVCCAAVSDYRPKICERGKLKKGGDEDKLSCLELVENPDILNEISSHKSDSQVVVGFAAEANDVIDNAKAKLKAKGCDMIVANDISNSQTFGKDKSKIFIISEEETVETPLQSKLENACLIISCAKKLFEQRRP